MLVWKGGRGRGGKEVGLYSDAGWRDCERYSDCFCSKTQDFKLSRAILEARRQEHLKHQSVRYGQSPINLPRLTSISAQYPSQLAGMVEGQPGRKMFLASTVLLGNSARR